MAVDKTYAQSTSTVNTPGSGNTTVQFNWNGKFAGDNGFRYNQVNKELIIQGNVNVGGWVKGKIYTNQYNFFLTGGQNGHILSTDGTGNIRWTNPTTLTTDYSNANVTAYLPTHTGNIGGGNINVLNTVYSSNLSATGTSFLTNVNVNGTSRFSNVSSIKIPGGTSGQVLTSDGANNLTWTTPVVTTSLPWSNVSNKPSFATVATSGSYNDLTDQPTLVTNHLTNGTLVATLDSSGSLNVPSLLPITFTMVLDEAHMVDAVAFAGGDYWHFDVTFNVNTSGSIETQINNSSPWVSNPGYVDGYQYVFTESDHGIPGYTFGVTLSNITLAGPAGYTVNLSATPPPTLPSTINSVQTIKLTSGAANLVFDTNGLLTAPYISGDGGNISNVQVANVSGLGNIATISLDGNVSNILFGDGTFGPVGASYDQSLNTSDSVQFARLNLSWAINQTPINSIYCPTNADTVVYTSTDQYDMTVKLILKIEAQEGGSGPWETQSCEMMIAKSWNNNKVAGSVYGLVYTSNSPLVTFDARWNSSISRIEVICRPTVTAGAAYVSAHVTEIRTSD